MHRTHREVPAAVPPWRKELVAIGIVDQRSHEGPRQGAIEANVPIGEKARRQVQRSLSRGRMPRNRNARRAADAPARCNPTRMSRDSHGARRTGDQPSQATLRQPGRRGAHDAEYVPFDVYPLGQKRQTPEHHQARYGPQ